MPVTLTSESGNLLGIAQLLACHDISWSFGLVCVICGSGNSEKCSTREKGRDQYDIYLSVGKSKTPWPIFRLLLTQCWGGAWWRKYIKSESQLTLWNNNLPGPWDNLAQPVQKITVDALYFSLVVLIFFSFFFLEMHIFCLIYCQLRKLHRMSKLSIRRP